MGNMMHMGSHSGLCVFARCFLGRIRPVETRTSERNQRDSSVTSSQMKSITSREIDDGPVARKTAEDSRSCEVVSTSPKSGQP